MTNTLKLIGAALVLALGFPGNASASTMKCGTHIISYGQGQAVGQYEVLKRCGEPTARQGNTWIYEKSSSVTRRVRFNSQGEIINIE